MKRGISIGWEEDAHGNSVVTIRKTRGKLTLDEIIDTIQFGEGQKWCARYAILLNCTEDTIGGNGMWFGDMEEKGDAVDLYRLDDSDTCPVCNKNLPPFEYCPNCGNTWKDMNQDVEKLIAAMKEETAREIGRAKSLASKIAWYWTYIGSLDMAQQLGYITDARRQELYAEVADLKPAMP